MEPDLLDNPAAGPAAVRGGIVRVAGYVVGVGVTTASAAVLFRHLGVADAGRFVLILSVVNLAAGLADAGLTGVAVREAATRGPEAQRELLANLLALRILLTVVGIAGACAYAVLAGFSDRLIGATAIAGAGLMAQNLQNAYATPLMVRLMLVQVTLLDLFRMVLVAVLTVTFAVAGASLVPFFVIAPIAGAATTAATLWVARGLTPLRPRLNPAVWRPLLRQTLPFALAVAVATLYFRLGILLVDLLSSTRQTGLFGASFRIVEVLVVLPALAVGAALPIFARAARDDTERLRYGIGLVAEAMAILGAALTLALAAGAPVAIDIVAGSDFDGAVPVLRLHAVALLFTFMTAPFGYGLLSLRRHREIVVANVAGIVVLAVGMALLVPDHGARGAALATIVGEAVLAGTTTGLLMRGGVQLELGRIPRVFVAAAVAAIPAALLPAIPAVLAAELVFVAGLFLLRAIPAEALEVFRR